MMYDSLDMVRDRRMDGRTDRLMDGETDGRMDEQTEKVDICRRIVVGTPSKKDYNDKKAPNIFSAS